MQVDPEVARLQLPAAELESAERAIAAQAVSPEAQARIDELHRTHGWRTLHPALRPHAFRLFDLAWYVNPAKLKAPIRCARLRHSGFVVKDPVHAMAAGSRQWSAFTCSDAAESVVAMRRRAIHANRPHFANGLWFGKHRGETAYLIGNGPSGAQAREWIPPRGQRKGKVVCLNGSSKWFSGDMDYWTSWDWLGKDHWYNDRDFTGCEALFSLYAAHHCVEGTRRQGARAQHFFNGGNRNPYRRHGVDQKGRDLPSAEEGLETMFSTLHVLWWLGFRHVVLFGAEHAIAPESGCLHGGERDARQPARRVEVDVEHGIAQLFAESGELLYTEVPDYKGDPCWTTPHLHNGAAFLVAQSMFLRDSGVEIVNCSMSGLDFLFAPMMEPKSVVPLLEGYAVEGWEDQSWATIQRRGASRVA